MDKMVIFILLLLTIIVTPIVYFIIGVTGKKIQFNKFNKDTIISKLEEKFIIFPYNKGSEYTPQFEIFIDLYLKVKNCFHKNNRKKLLVQYWQSLFILILLLVASIFFTKIICFCLITCVLCNYVSGVFFDIDNYFFCNIVIINKISYLLITMPGQRGRQLVEK
jgi:hypothetical protein